MPTPEQFLEETFEFELCHECGGDAENHIAVLLDLGEHYGANYFALCRAQESE